MFTYEIDGKKYELEYSHKFVVIRTKDNKALATSLRNKSSKALLDKLEPFDEYPHKGVYIMKVQEEATRSVTFGNDVREKLNKEDKIRFAGRALEDPRTGRP